MNRGPLLFISFAILLFFSGVTFLTANETFQNLESVVIDNFDHPNTGQQWYVQGSRFIAPGMPLVTYANAWPEALYGSNKQGLDLKVLAIKAAFDRQGYNYLEIIPVKKAANGTVTPSPISLPGVVKQLDVWAWGSNYDYYLQVVVQDYNGRVYTLNLGSLKYVGWEDLSTAIPTYIPQTGGHVSVGGFIRHLELVKFVLWTKPTESVAGFNFYMDQVKVLTNTFITRFDGDNLADPATVEKIWSNVGGK